MKRGTLRTLAIASVAAALSLITLGTASAAHGSLVVNGTVALQNPENNRCYRLNVRDGSVLDNQTSAGLQVFKTYINSSNCSGVFLAIPSEEKRTLNRPAGAVRFVRT
jgi:hypothetical protein